MNKTKLSILLLITAVLLIFSSCGNMITESEDISIDLSSVVSKDLTDQYAKIRVVATGTSNFLELADAEAIQPIVNGKVSLTEIPVGPDYTIYLSVGTYENNLFKVLKAFNGEFSVTGGETTAVEIKISTIKATPVDFFTGKELKGIAAVGGDVYTVNVDGTKLYYGTTGSYVDNPAPDTFNNVTAGYGDKAVISMKSTTGRGFTTYDGGLNPAYADGMAAKFTGEDKSVDVLSADVFWDDTEQLELVVGQTESGLALHVEDFSTGEEALNEWMVLDLSPYLAQAGLELKGKLINAISVVKKYSDAAHTEVSALWVFMASQAGDFRIKIPLAADGFDITPQDNESEVDVIMDMFEPFKTGNALEGRKVLGMTTPGNDTLYIGTDMGLYKATATETIADMVKTGTSPVAAAGKRVEKLTGGTNYTAGVTALNLLVLRNSDNKVAKIAFNEGLPVAELLSDGAVSGMSWNGDILYIAGDYGLASVNAADLTYE